MQVSPYLRSWNARADGKRALVVRVNIGQQRAFTEPIEWITAEWWDEEQRAVKRRINGKKNDRADQINASIRAVVLQIEDYARQHPAADPKEIVKGYKIISSAYVSATDVAGISFFAYVERRLMQGEKGLVKDKKTSLPISGETVRGWRTSFRRLQAFADKYGEFSWQHIDNNLYNRLIDFLRLEFVSKKETNLRENSIGSTIKHFKAFINAAMEEQLPEVPDISLRILAGFRKPGEQIETEVLSAEQIDHLKTLDLQWYPSQDDERARFLLAHQTLLRDSDRIDIAQGNITVLSGQRFVMKKQIKTTRPVVVPCTQLAFDIITAGVKPVDNVHSNRVLKELMKKAGFDQLRTHSYLVGGKRTKVTSPQWKLITTHTARRSAATHLYLWGEDIGDIQHWGGWATAKQAEEYIKVQLWRQARDISKRGEFFKTSYLPIKKKKK